MSLDVNPFLLGGTASDRQQLGDGCSLLLISCQPYENSDGLCVESCEVEFR